MTFTVDVPTKSLGVQFTDAEWAVLVAARQRHGADAPKDLLRRWLRDMWRQGEDARLKTLEAMPPVELTEQGG